MNDAFAHTFNEAEHISEVHFKYGKNHLEKSLAETSDTNDRNKNQNTVKSGDETSFHVGQQVCNYNFSITNIKKHYFSYNPGKLPFVLISSQGPPPKFYMV